MLYVILYSFQKYNLPEEIYQSYAICAIVISWSNQN